MIKAAVIFGATGQDSSYLAELLLQRDYYVVGVARRTSTPNDARIRHLLREENFELVPGDITDAFSVHRIIEHFRPHEVYNLAAQSVTADCLCPILAAQGISHVSLAKLWQEQEKKGKIVRVERTDEIDVEVIDLPVGTQICALGMWNGMGTWFPIRQISRHRYTGKVAKLTQKFGSVTVTPNHSLLDVHQKICKPEDNPWLLNIRKLNYKPNQYKKTVRLRMYGRVESDKEFFWLREKGSIGKVRREVKGDSLKSLCRIIAAFVAEGHTSFNKCTGIYTVNISQNDKSWLESLSNDLSLITDARMCICTHKKEGFANTHRLEIKSRTLYGLMRHMCGVGSHEIHLPDWFAQLEPELLRVIFDTLIEGDGCHTDYGWRYTTTSYKLACQFSMLITMLGYDYTVYRATTEQTGGNHEAWQFRECTSYQPDKGSDGKQLEWLDYDGWVYDISVAEVENFAIGVGNIVVHNSHVKISFDEPSHTTSVVYQGTLNILEALRAFREAHSDLEPPRFYQASSSEMFGSSYSVRGGTQRFQDESTPMLPNSPYAVAKLAAHHLVRLYREAYGLFACSGILFNHESPRRGDNFVTRKISLYTARLARARSAGIYIEPLLLGNLGAKRDWGHARDFVRAMWLMLQRAAPADYVIATGEVHTVAEFLEECFARIGIRPEKVKNHFQVDSELFRPCEVPFLCGDASKAHRELGWSPTYSFRDLVADMVEHDLGMRHSVEEEQSPLVVSEK